MSRPMKMNETPVSPFNLREIGPLSVSEVSRMLKGASYRTASGAKADTRATIDPNPCPHCGSNVEWALTSKRNPAGGMIDRYVYARCRGRAQHKFSFRPGNAVPHAVPVVAIPAPRPSNPAVLTTWIESQRKRISSELDRLDQIGKLAEEIFKAPMPVIPQNGK